MVQRVKSTKQKKRKNHPAELCTQRDHEFVRHYLKMQNGTRAAIAAGFPPASAHVTASRLLKNTKVLTLIEQARQKMRERTEISIEKLVTELARIGFANMEDFIRIDGEGQPHIDLSDVSTDDMAAIQEITTETFMEGPEEMQREVRRTKIKLHPKLDALEKIAKHLGLYGRKGQGVEDPDGEPARQQVFYTLKIGNAHFNISRADGEQAGAPSKQIEGQQVPA